MLASQSDFLNASSTKEAEASLFQVIMSNNSPALPIWFTIMLLNILGLILLF